MSKNEKVCHGSTVIHVAVKWTKLYWFYAYKPLALPALSVCLACLLLLRASAKDPRSNTYTAAALLDRLDKVGAHAH